MGFEPTTFCLEGRSSTTELHPRILRHASGLPRRPSSIVKRMRSALVKRAAPAMMNPMNMPQLRSYGSLTPCVRLLILANSVIFLLEWLSPGYRLHGLALNADDLFRRGYVWQLVTYMFLHASPGHVLMNMLSLGFLGPAVEWGLGRKNFLILYAVSGVLGGLGFALLDPVGRCVGASGAVFGVLAAFAALYPRQKMALIFLPFVALPAWLMVVIITLVEWSYLLHGVPGRVANSAHLAGAVAGWFYVRAILWARRRPPPAPPPVRHDSADDLLDKIAARGLHALTREERTRLDRVSRERRQRGR